MKQPSLFRSKVSITSLSLFVSASVLENKKASALPCDRALRIVLHLAYHRSVPWHEFEQERVDGFQPGVLPLAIFITPLACVAEFTLVEL